MIALLGFVLPVLAAPFKSKSRLEAENAVLRHQLINLRRKMEGRVRLTDNDRWFFVQLYRWFPSILTVLSIIQPETLVRWHRPDLAVIGAGNRAHGEGGRRLRRSSVH
jgi:hypothetical protein